MFFRLHKPQEWETLSKIMKHAKKKNPAKMQLVNFVSQNKENLS